MTDADLIAALAARQDAWIGLGVTTPLGRMTPATRQRVEAASVAFHHATQRVVAGLRERRGIFEHKGSTYLLNEDGDGFVCSDAMCVSSGNGVTAKRALRLYLAKLRDLNARRFRPAREGVA